MARTVRHPRTRAQSVAHHNRQVAGVTAGLLVLISAYSAVLGSNGWLWFGWTVLLLACVALFAVRA
ncbi:MULTISPECIES: hypothetical protein [unclassified Streptomyces]|uniref:hypothetical protein n=1 Tax=Streptomycetaceae TaxID=2062 RepID=UPI002E7AAD34|nr:MULTISPECIES: hypothetical protein [unclassified Streptomyces]MED7953527.1 hypothetical protein [Streptomyces sp. BE303]MEE1823005.1 hypothetical protein [Streptomyces sp. BE20]